MFDDANRYSMSGDQKRDATHREHWNAVGRGGGNRKEDRPDAQGQVANSRLDKVEDIAEVGQINLDGIETKTKGAQEGQTGTYRETTSGSMSKMGEPELSYDSEDGVWELEGGRAAIGHREKVGVRGYGERKGEHGSGVLKGDAHALYELGADSSFGGDTEEGLLAQANAGGRIGVGGSGDADLKTKGYQVDGVEKPVDFGIGAHGDTFLGLKGGGNLKLGMTPEYMGGEGRLGGFLGFEAAGDLHGNVGPLAGKLGGSFMAGVGAGLEGGITLENWRLKIGGKMYAAWGYGASGKGEIEIDLKQAYQLGMRGAKELYEVADADKDSKLTLNDPATHAALAMRGQADLADKAATGLMSFLDRDQEGEGKGKFTREDIALGAEQLGDALGDAKDKIVEGGIGLLLKGGDAARRGAGEVKDLFTNDKGELDLTEVKTHLGNAGTQIMDTARDLGTGIRNTAGDARDFLVDTGEKGAKAAVDYLDADKDGLDMDDARALGSKAWGGIRDTGRAVGDATREALSDAKGMLNFDDSDDELNSKDVVAAGKAAASGIGRAAKATKKAAVQTYRATVAAGKSAYDAAEKGVKNAVKAAGDAVGDKDGELELEDLGPALDQAGTAMRSGAKSAVKSVRKGAKAAGDWFDSMGDKDGHFEAKDVVSAAGKGVDAVVGGARSLVTEGKAQLDKAATTLSAGYKAASQSLKGTWNRVSSFFGW